MRRSPASAAATLALAACAARAGVPIRVDPAREAAAARAVAEAFITLEARGDVAADTLLAPDADFINTGVVVTARPRLAAVIGPGEATVDGMRTQVAGELGWVVAVYRWTGDVGGEVGRGRVTMVLERGAAGWRIRHVHSSSVAPWE
jgi:hypothetical protein